MPRIPRQLLVDLTKVGIYYCINRCLRRAFLCGRVAVTGKSFEHRKEGIQNRVQFLAVEFGIDVLGFAVMSNHLHVVVRNRPDVVRGWSDREVPLRRCRLFPSRRDEKQTVDQVGAGQNRGTMNQSPTWPALSSAICHDDGNWCDDGCIKQWPYRPLCVQGIIRRCRLYEPRISIGVRNSDSSREATLQSA